jgi:hypothetical protein
LLEGGGDQATNDNAGQSNRVDAFKSLLEAVKSGDLGAAQEALSSLNPDAANASGGSDGSMHLLMLAQRAYSEWQSADATQPVSA